MTSFPTMIVFYGGRLGVGLGSVAVWTTAQTLAAWPSRMG
jgi:hypothetical protein